MAYSAEDHKKLMARVRRIEGQVQALGKALEQDADTLRILQQIASIRGAANGLLQQVLEAHISSHLSAPGRSAKQQAEDSRQLLEVLRSYLK